MRTTIQRSLELSLLAAALALASGSCGSEHGGGGQLTAPTALKAMVLPGPAVHLTWQDTASEHHYSIERKDGAGEFKEISTKEINMTVYHDADVKTGTYTYRIAGASHDNTKGPYSAEVMAVVP